MIFQGIVHIGANASVVTIKNRLAGRVTVNAAGAMKRVVVQKRGTLEYVASTHSNADGTWEIRGLPILPPKSLQVFYIDDTENFDPIAFDYISQEE